MAIAISVKLTPALKRFATRTVPFAPVAYPFIEQIIPPLKEPDAIAYERHRGGFIVPETGRTDGRNSWTCNL